jgi:translation initiation factor IF-3
LRINREIRAPKVRVIDQNGQQIGIISIREALSLAEEAGMDLVEVVAASEPPVCKIMNFGKFRYDQTKKDKENKKTQHQIRVKEIKFKPNIDPHDLQTKLKQARLFIEKGNKVKLTCTFRGRELIHPEIGEQVMRKVCAELEDIAAPESPLKMMGRALNTVLAPIPSARRKTESA